MGEAYDLLLKIKEKCREKGLMENLTVSRVGLKSGVPVSQLNENSEYDSEKISKMKKAAQEVLGEAV